MNELKGTDAQEMSFLGRKRQEEEMISRCDGKILTDAVGFFAWETTARRDFGGGERRIVRTLIECPSGWTELEISAEQLSTAQVSAVRASMSQAQQWAIGKR